MFSLRCRCGLVLSSNAVLFVACCRAVGGARSGLAKAPCLLVVDDGSCARHLTLLRQVLPLLAVAGASLSAAGHHRRLCATKRR